MKKLNFYPSLYILLEDMKSATASYKPSLFKIVLRKLFCTRWAPNGARRRPRDTITLYCLYIYLKVGLRLYIIMIAYKV